MKIENENLEFKVTYTEEIYKEVIAFANTEGGKILVGVDDNGNTVGLDNVDDVYTRITNGIRDAINPDITTCIKYSLQPGNIISIDIGEGTAKPYYLKSKGIKPNGVYVRQGASCAQASNEKIRSLIKESDGDIYEQIRSLEQDLSFNSISGYFSKCGIEFDKNKYLALGIVSPCLQYTNLGLIVSDQCPYTTKIAVFADGDNTEFIDRREFSGSVIKQVDETFDYLALCNKTKAVITGLQRKERMDYPPEAVREAYLNALIHREYSFSGSIIINVNSECIEFISLGGLMQGLTKEDILNGVSQLRNRNLAGIFQRVKLIESYGTGLRRIYKLYDNCSAKPEISITPNSFRITLPNMNTVNKSSTVNSNNHDHIQLTPQKKEMLSYLSEHKTMSEEELMELLNIGKTRAYSLSKEMEAKGLITITGRGKNKRLLFKE